MFVQLSCSQNIQYIFSLYSIFQYIFPVCVWVWVEQQQQLAVRLRVTGQSSPLLG